ncbi:MAG TPA: ATP-binding protein [Phycisphaerae bacterium]|nr:ATP-binding protein [Phycisphaerae bacterium]
MNQPPGDVRFPVVLRVTSETCNLVTVRSAVLAVTRQIGFDEPDVSAIALAIDEAVANVIRHGYEGRPGHPIEIIFDRLNNREGPGLEVRICDRGRQVAPATIVGRELDDVRPGGLGTHIIRTVMDEVEYSLRQPEGMQVRLVKRLKNCDDVSESSESPCSRGGG